MTRCSRQHHPPELRERAVRMVFEVQGSYESQWAAITEVAHKLKRLRRENAELKRANDIPKAVSAFFAAEIDWPPRRS